MRARVHWMAGWVVTIAAVCGSAAGRAQSVPGAPAEWVLPDAPAPAMAQDAALLGTAAQSPAAQQTQGGQSSSSAQNGQPQADSAQSQREKAQQQLKEEEKQRVLGVVPNFNITYHADAAPLSAGQKLNLAFHSSVDPFTFGAAVLVAGYHEANDDYGGFGWGAEGFGKRAGAAYLDAFDGTMIGNGVLPAIFHQDPRYFRLGHGTTTHRLLYAAATTVMCKHDNPRRWEPNFSNVGGNIIAGAISNLYYPSQNSGWGETISNGMIVTGEGTLGAVFDEFWPDVSRKLFHKDPTHGLDAQMRAADAAAKKNKKQALEPSPK